MDTTYEPTQEQVGKFVIAAHGNLAAVKEMLAEQPALLNARYQEFNETALEAASHMGRREIAQHLLSAGAPLTICAASMLGLADQVEEFLDADPSQANARGAHGIPVMFHAAMSGNTEIAEMLLARGGGEGMSGAVHGAINYGQKEMVSWLLDHGAGPNEPNFEGKSPLQVATERGNDDLAGLLRSRGGTQ
jgi:uncharacterized protein